MDDKNHLYYGDNLDVLRRYIASDSVDLIYLDPPFNSRQDYNVLYAEKDGKSSASQVTAFKDTWEWNEDASRAYIEIVEQGGRVAEAMRSFRTLLGGSDMLAYLAMMAPRLVELRRVLKPTGSIYLHCDPTASHYLKLLMDSVFGPLNFRNEIIWRRSHPKGHAFTRFASNHDVILFYAKSPANYKWNPLHTDHDPERALQQYSLRDPDGRAYQLTSLLNPNKNRPNLTYEFLGTTKVWRWSKERMQEAYEAGRIVVPRGGEGIPRYKRYLDEQEGIPVSDVWNDIEISSGRERLGYPTQKPESLLERIINASSDEGDLVLDPFCGCGTTVQVSQKLNRRWIGIDITHLAIGLIKTRLDDAFTSEVRKTYLVHGAPTDFKGAEQLAQDNKHQFQYWALDLVGAQPADGIRMGADRGIDGRIYFHEVQSETKQIIFSVKGGRNVGVAEVRDLIGVLTREKADIGVYITFTEPTRAMQKEAADAGFYTSDDGSKYPRVQLLTIKGLMDGTQHLQVPRHVENRTFKRAPKFLPKPATNLSLNLGEGQGNNTNE